MIGALVAGKRRGNVPRRQGFTPGPGSPAGVYRTFGLRQRRRASPGSMSRSCSLAPVNGRGKKKPPLTGFRLFAASL